MSGTPNWSEDVQSLIQLKERIHARIQEVLDEGSLSPEALQALNQKRLKLRKQVLHLQEILELLKKGEPLKIEPIENPTDDPVELPVIEEDHLIADSAPIFEQVASRVSPAQQWMAMVIMGLGVLGLGLTMIKGLFRSEDLVVMDSNKKFSSSISESGSHNIRRGSVAVTSIDPSKFRKVFPLSKVSLSPEQQKQWVDSVRPEFQEWIADLAKSELLGPDVKIIVEVHQAPTYRGQYIDPTQASSAILSFHQKETQKAAEALSVLLVQEDLLTFPLALWVKSHLIKKGMGIERPVSHSGLQDVTSCGSWDCQKSRRVEVLLRRSKPTHD